MKQTIEYGIAEIKEHEFMVNEAVQLGESSQVHFNVSIKPSKDRLDFIITATFEDKKSQEVYLRGKVSTGFLIKPEDVQEDLAKYPMNAMIIFFSLSYTHARAVLARSAAGSKFANSILPPINPDEQYKKLFGHLYE